MSRWNLTVILTTLALGFWARPGVASPAEGRDGDRLAYLEELDPYHVGLDFPKLTTPQWVGEPGVEAAVILAIDDMRDPAKYEQFLRPILDRLKAIDGRAPLSIMTCEVDPQDPQLQAWLKEGLSLEIHTLKHPCPLLARGDFPAAARNYHGCVDLMNRIPGNRPVAFRMPCCDSQNTLSPRFFAEIFNKTSEAGNFLSIDTSVFNILTSDDPALPRELVQDPDGRERFGKYLPFPSFVNTIENYPYPYVIGKTCWEFPCVVPSDWEGQNLQGVNSPRTVADLKAALDAIVLKRGTFTLVFHPHGWIQAEQIVDLIDHAVKTHGEKVKFLNFREAKERLDRNLLAGSSLRGSAGRDKGVRILDLNADGHLDVVLGAEGSRQTRLWDPKAGRWESWPLPARVVEESGSANDAGVRFGLFGPEGQVLMLQRDSTAGHAWLFEGDRWEPRDDLLKGLEIDGAPVPTAKSGRDAGLRFRDLDGDGASEVIVADQDSNRRAVFRWSRDAGAWKRLPFDPPPGAWISGLSGTDGGLRFIDLDEDGHEDLYFSNDEISGIFLFDSLKTGWSRPVTPRDESGEALSLPRVVRGPNGENNGLWVHSRHLWWHNEDTSSLPDLVDRRSFNDLLKDVEARGKAPEASLRSIRVRPGFRVELVASEPLVMDPIAFDWGADGKLWVVEMADYPLGGGGEGKPAGRVRFLEDTNGDGRYDKSTVFLDDLLYPNGVMPWRNGVLISAAPDILYAEDRDGDGRADHREVLFTGFVESNPQHRVNGFALGLDGWVYLADVEGQAIQARDGGPALEIKGMDARIQPDDRVIEPESGRSQYGRRRDDWGDWFGNNNSWLGWHYVLADGDIRRNPLLKLSGTRRTLTDENVLFPVSRTLSRFNEPWSAGRVTSACSPEPYRDDLFGPLFERSLFVAEPVHDLVRRVALEPDGASFQGHRAVGEETRAFLASSDNWFRPTTVRTGPDGALWIADMYRAVIEHPEWIPDDWEARIDLYAGNTMGRIYRVFPVDREPRPIPRLDRLNTVELVAAMETPNGWQRDTAQRLLLHRATELDGATIDALKRLATEGARPEARLQALWTLADLDKLDTETSRHGLADPHPEVRRNAAMACRNLLKDHSEILPSVAALAGDEGPRVRLAAALALGDSRAPEAGRALASIASRDHADPWIRPAVLSSATPHARTILSVLFERAGDGEPPRSLVEPLAQLIAGQDDPAAVFWLLEQIVSPGPDGSYADWQLAAYPELGVILTGAWPDLSIRRSGEPTQPAREAERLKRDGPTFEAAVRRILADPSQPAAQRVLALRALGTGGPLTIEIDHLAERLAPSEPPELQQAALGVLARSGDSEVPEILLAGWRSHAPALRAAILDTLLSRKPWTSALVSALEEKRVPASEIGATPRGRLLENPDPELRSRAAAVLGASTTARKEVIDRYRAALRRPGNPEAGRAVFEKSCATCHRLDGQGTAVGPDLASLSDRSPEALLTAILDPNRAVESQYASYTVATADGRVLSGIIAAESSNSLTLRREEGQQDILLRAEIDQMASSGQSLMPEGLENDLTPAALADLIAYLAGVGPDAGK